MKILWLSNTIFPNVCQKLGLDIPFGGGWMHSIANSLINIENTNLAVVAIYDKIDIQLLKIGKITHYLVPNKPSEYKRFFIEIIKDFNPDIIHIHGTEYPHSLSMLEASESQNVVVSVQGLVSEYAKYYMGGISKINPTLRDIIRNDRIVQQQKNMSERGILERKLLGRAKHVIGRTSWDKSHIWNINPSAEYHFCNETLRDLFYTQEWDLGKCEKYSIFLSQAHYPIKGIQQLIEALPIILKFYPKTRVYVAGNNFFDVPSYRKNGFARYVECRINTLGIKDKFIFLGPLSESEMVDQYLKSHVFLCPSAIENSPNSVGEAQILGVPVVSAFVGGTMDMIDHGKTGFLYRFEESTMMAYFISKLFEDDNLCNFFSVEGKKVAQQRHSKSINAERLFSIYKNIKR